MLLLVSMVTAEPQRPLPAGLPSYLLGAMTVVCPACRGRQRGRVSSGCCTYMYIGVCVPPTFLYVCGCGRRDQKHLIISGSARLHGDNHTFFLWVFFFACTFRSTTFFGGDFVYFFK